MTRLIVGIIVGIALTSAVTAGAITWNVLRIGDNVRVGSTSTRCHVSRGVRTGRAFIFCGPLTTSGAMRAGMFYVGAGVDRVCLFRANGTAVACRWNQ
jgi:hypothetical protein